MKNWFCHLRSVSQRYIMVTILLGSVIAVATFAPHRLSAAQNNSKVVTYDQPVSGNIDDQNVQEIWSLSVPAKDRLSIAVQRTDGTLVPSVQLFDPNNRSIAVANYDDTYARAAIPSTKLSSPGNYSVVVSRYHDKNGRTSGSYSLVVSLLGAGVERPELYTFKSEPLPAGVSYDSELSNAKWVDAWRLHTHNVTHILLVATRLSNNLIPTMYLYGSNGKEIQHADSDSTESKSQLDVVLSDNADFELRVMRKDNEDGSTSGKYSLTMIVLGGSSNTSVVTGELKIGESKQGKIRNEVWQEIWILRINQPTTLTIITNRMSGTLIPAVQVLDANRKELIHAIADEPFTTATIQDYAFKTPGNYLVVVYRPDGALGGTAGDYQLLVNAGKP